MAMTKEGMADKILFELGDASLLNGADPEYLRPYWEAISKGIIREITENMDVTVEVDVENVQLGSSTIVATGQDTLIE
jgi:hypothetical protein